MKLVIYILLLNIIFSCSTDKKPFLKLSTYTINLGYIETDTIYEEKLTVYNMGDEDLILKETSGDCNCLSVCVENTLVHPHDSTILHLSLNTQSKGNGQIENMIFIVANTDSTSHFVQVIGYVK